MKRAILAILAILVLVTGCAPGGESAGSEAADTIPIEMVLGDEMGTLRFQIPAVFKDDLDLRMVPADTAEFCLAIQFWIKNADSPEQILTLNVVEQSLYDRWVAADEPLPSVMLEQGGYLVGDWLTPYNPMEEGTEAYRLVEDHLPGLRKSIRDSIAWDQ